MTTDKIIDQCLLGLGEQDTTSPTAMTRVQVLEVINQLYQNDIGRRLKCLASYSYDASDAAHTITTGVGALPSDFLLPAQVYDGDAPDNDPLEQIFRIEDKVADTDDTSQYMIPDNEHIWLFGQTPTDTPKMYYYRMPIALTDSALSSPVDLKSEYHVDIFVARCKEIYAMWMNNTYDMIDMKSLVLDYLKEIEYAHGFGKADETPGVTKSVYGGFE